MKYYTEITLVKDGEVSPYFIWSKLYAQVHLAFVEQKDANDKVAYGVSFPEYKDTQSNSLGSKLRIFANSEEELVALNLGKWLARLTDYVHIKSPKAVGNVLQHVSVSRFHQKHSIEKLARRRARKHNITVEAAIADLTAVDHENNLKGYVQKLKKCPHIKLKSLSNEGVFDLCINQTVTDQFVEGDFSTYGLSATSTVPHW